MLGANGDFASLNLFTYCGNNPVSRADSSGYLWEIVVAGVIASVISGVANAAATAISGGTLEECIVAGLIATARAARFPAGEKPFPLGIVYS